MIQIFLSLRLVFMLFRAFECVGIIKAIDVPCQDWFFTDLISTRGLGVRGWPRGKTEMLRSVVVLPE